MKKDKTQLEVILEALQSLGSGEYTTAEIMEAIPTDQAYRFKKPREVSTILSKLKEANKVINGSTVYDNGRAKLTWISTNAISTHQPVVSAASKTEKTEVNTKVPENQENSASEFCGDNQDGFEVALDVAGTPVNEPSALILSAAKTIIHSAEWIAQLAIDVEAQKEIQYLDEKINMLDDLIRVFNGSKYAQLLAEIKEDLQA